MVGRRRKFSGLLCPRQPYNELFCVEQKAKIIINNTWNIPFFTFIEQKNCQLTFLTSNIEHKPHEKSILVIVRTI